MTTAKEFLQQAYFIHRRILTLERQRQQIRADIYGVRSPSNMSPDRVQSSITGDRLEKLIAKVDAKERDIVGELEELYKRKDRVTASIKRLDAGEKWKTEIYQDLLIHRYVMFEQWQDIASFLHMGVRHVFKLHGEALKVFGQMLEDGSSWHV